MQEARKVVSSPKWQTSADVLNTPQTESTDGKSAAKEETSTTDAASVDTQETFALSSDPGDLKSATGTKDAAASETTETSETASDEVATTDSTSTLQTARSTVEPPSMLLKGPLLTLTALCAAAAAAWSYSALEDTRTQLASITSAKASLEQSLNEARAKLVVAEKTVADVKAAITAATAPAKAATAAPAAK